MASGGSQEQKVFADAMRYMQEKAPSDYQKLLNHSRYGEVEKSMRDVIQNELKLTSKLTSGRQQDATSILKSHLGRERVDLIANAFQIETITIQMDEEDNSLYHITRGGRQVRPSIRLNTQANILKGTFLQAGSIIVEELFMTLTIIGVAASIQEMDDVCEKTGELIRNTSAVQRTIARVSREWEDAAIGQRARMIFDTIKDTYIAGALWNVVKLICQSMSWFDWIRTAAVLIATLVAAFATDAVAIVARIVQALINAYTLEQKFVNYNNFQSR